MGKFREVPSLCPFRHFKSTLHESFDSGRYRNILAAGLCQPSIQSGDIIFTWLHQEEISILSTSYHSECQAIGIAKLFLIQGQECAYQ